MLTGQVEVSAIGLLRSEVIVVKQYQARGIASDVGEPRVRTAVVLIVDEWIPGSTA